MKWAVKSFGIHVTCRSRCVFLFQPLRKGQIHVECSGVPEVLEDSRKVRAIRNTLLFSDNCEWPNIFATFIVMHPLPLPLVGILNTFLLPVNILTQPTQVPHNARISWWGTTSLLPEGSLMPICHCISVPLNSLKLDLPLLPHSLVSRNKCKGWALA